MRNDSTARQVSFLSLFTPALEHWRAMVLIPLIAAGITAAVVLLRPREWRATMALSTIMTSRDLPLSGGLANLLAAGNMGGLQPTPALIVRLANQYGVLYRTAHAPIAPGGPTVLQQLEAREGRIREADVVRTMSKLVHTSFDKQTGVITLEVVAEDSALARFIALRLVDEVSETFVRSSRAQAREVREAMEARVDSAARALHRDEERLRTFLAQNRQMREFSEAFLEQQRLSRAVTISHATYSQAVAAREDALGRELEETPAVVVVDPLPERLLPVSRRVAIKTVIAAVLAALLSWLLLLARSTLRDGLHTDAETARFTAAMLRVPLVGRVAGWALHLPREVTERRRIVA